MTWLIRAIKKSMRTDLTPNSTGEPPHGTFGGPLCPGQAGLFVPTQEENIKNVRKKKHNKNNKSPSREDTQ